MIISVNSKLIGAYPVSKAPINDYHNNGSR